MTEYEAPKQDVLIYLSNESDLTEDSVTEEAAYAVGNPSYKDLVEENAYLRSERSQLYDELARVSVTDAPIRSDMTRDEVIESLEKELIKEKDRNVQLIDHFDFLKSEIEYLLNNSPRRFVTTPTEIKEKEISLKALYYREYKRKTKQ